MASVGRRKNKIDFITIDEAVAYISEKIKETYGSHKVIKRMGLSKGTLYNKISQGKLINYGGARCVLLDPKELDALI